MNLISLELTFGLIIIPTIIVADVLAEIVTPSWPERIVGGVDVPPGYRVAYQVSLQYLMNPEETPDTAADYKHFCGGSIISRYHILTAAHCCYGFESKRMSIVAGVRDLRDPLAVRRTVNAYKIHPKYVELQSSDIAILELTSPLELDNITMTAIDVSNNQRVPAGTNVFLTGWGLRLPFQPQIPFSWPLLQEQLNAVSIPSILQVMNFRTVSDFECKLVIEQLTDTELCVKGDFISGACSGDSGGPLVLFTPNGWQQVGLVSYGLFVCGIFNSLVPDVYTRISEFTDWIQSNI